MRVSLIGSGHPDRICTLITGCFHDKTIISTKNVRVLSGSKISGNKCYLETRSSVIWKKEQLSGNMNLLFNK